jgi:hypothetical protein
MQVHDRKNQCDVTLNGVDETIDTVIVESLPCERMGQNSLSGSMGLFGNRKPEPG